MHYCRTKKQQIKGSKNKRTAFVCVVVTDRSPGFLATARGCDTASFAFSRTSITSIGFGGAFQCAFAVVAVEAAALASCSASYRFTFAIVALRVEFTTSGINSTDIIGVCFPALEATTAAALEVTGALIIFAACLEFASARDTGRSVAIRAGGADVLSATSGPERRRAGSTGPTIILVAPEKDVTVSIASRLDHVDDAKGLAGIDGHAREQAHRHRGTDTKAAFRSIRGGDAVLEVVLDGLKQQEEEEE